MIIGISGYGYTGSTAVFDLLKEYDEIDYIKTNKTLEFSFVYNPDGLFDLEFNVYRSPAKHLKGDWAIRRYLSYVNIYKKYFDAVTNGQFSRATEKYIDSIVQVEYRRYLTLLDEKYTKYPLVLIKALRIIQMRLEAKFKKDYPIVPKRTAYISVCPDRFLENTREYIAEVIQSTGLNLNKKVLLDQPFPPNNPTEVFHYYKDPYAIVVDRDPRDIYLIAKRLSHLAATYIPHDTVEDFVEAYRAIRRGQEGDDSHVLRINFEDLIYRYEDTVKLIESFLNLGEHTAPKKYLKPERSIATTQLYKVYPDEADNIKYIERNLKEYLYPYESFGEIAFNRNDLYTSVYDRPV